MEVERSKRKFFRFLQVCDIISQGLINLQPVRSSLCLFPKQHCFDSNVNHPLHVISLHPPYWQRWNPVHYSHLFDNGLSWKPNSPAFGLCIWVESGDIFRDMSVRTWPPAHSDSLTDDRTRHCVFTHIHVCPLHNPVMSFPLDNVSWETLWRHSFVFVYFVIQSKFPFIPSIIIWQFPSNRPSIHHLLFVLIYVTSTVLAHLFLISKRKNKLDYHCHLIFGTYF